MEIYREFADELIYCIAGFKFHRTYAGDPVTVIRDLERVYEASMLEEAVRGERVLACFLVSGYNYRPQHTITVNKLREFLRILKTGSERTRRVVLSNLHHRFDGVKMLGPKLSDEIPF